MTLRALELKVPPVAVFLLCAAGAWGVRRAAPGLQLALPWISAIAMPLALFGLAVGILGVIQFLRVGTTVHPTHPSRANRVVRSGLYGLSRNPMYLGLALVLAAIAAWLAHPLSFLVVPAFVTYMTRFQIVPEERALREKFGEPYAEYVRSVRRWI